MNFTSSSVNAALCDATEGFTTFNVVYNADGTWTVTPGVSRASVKADADGNLFFGEQELNTVIYNEAGTESICRGHSNSATSPYIVTALTHPSNIYVDGAYILSVNDDTPVGTDCVQKNGSTRPCTRFCGATRGCSCDCFSQYVVRSAKKPAVSPAVPYPTVC